MDTSKKNITHGLKPFLLRHNCQTSKLAEVTFDLIYIITGLHTVHMYGLNFSSTVLFWQRPKHLDLQLLPWRWILTYQCMAKLNPELTHEEIHPYEICDQKWKKQKQHLYKNIGQYKPAINSGSYPTISGDQSYSIYCTVSLTAEMVIVMTMSFTFEQRCLVTE